MEKKTTQRIIGVLIAISLVIILMPLLFTKNEGSDVATVSAPPLPDQPKLAATDSSSASTPATSSTTTSEPATVASSNTTSAATPDQSSTMPTPDKTSAATTASTTSSTTVSPAATDTQPATVASTDQSASAKINADTKKDASTSATPAASKTTDQHADAASTTQPVDASAKPEAQFSMITNPTQAGTATTDSEIKAPIVEANKTPAATTDHPKAKHVKSTKHHVASNKSNGKKAWAIQLGCFKDKNNAVRLTEKLHAAGYEAFSREIKSSKGNTTTRVYIGPEYKQASAEKLTTELEQELKIHGIVIPYKPLEG